LPKGYAWNDPLVGTSLDFVTKGLSQHTRVARYVELEPGLRYRIERNSRLPAINLWTCNVYILSESDVASILAAWPEVNCILSSSSYNSYTGAAKRTARAADVAVFMWGELLGALHRQDDDFLDHGSA
jgi:hypothetical protein